MNRSLQLPNHVLVVFSQPTPISSMFNGFKLSKKGTSDLVELRRLLFTEMLLDQSIIQLGGTSNTKMDHLVIYRYDETFEEEIELNSNDILAHGDKNLSVKIHHFVKVRRPRTVIDAGNGLMRTPYLDSSDSDVIDTAEELSQSSDASSKTHPDTSLISQNMQDKDQDCLELFTQPIQEEDSSEFLSCLGNTQSYSQSLVTDHSSAFLTLGNNENCSSQSLQQPEPSSAFLNLDNTQHCSQQSLPTQEDSVFPSLDVTVSHSGQQNKNSLSVMGNTKNCSQSLPTQEDSVFPSLDVTVSHSRQQNKNSLSVMDNIENYQEDTQSISKSLDVDEDSVSEKAKEEILSLPTHGNEPWQLSAKLVRAIEEKKVQLHIREFTLVFAKHLMKTHSKATKAIYNSYARMITNQYPCLKDRDGSWETMRQKIVKAIQNQRDNEKHRNERKLKRDEKKRKMKDQTEDTVEGEHQLDSQHCNDVVLDREALIRRKEEFDKRRLIVMKEATTLSTTGIIELIPDYETFDMVYGDFLMMEKMLVLNADINFKKKFAHLINEFKMFLQQEHGIGELLFSNGEMGILEVLLKINSLCSTKRGVLSPTPIFHRLKVGQSVEPNYNTTHPHTIVFFNGIIPHSLLIVGSEKLNYANIPCNTMWEAVLKTLSVYYVFDIEYPATFGILAVMDKFCLTADGNELPSARGNKTTKKRKANKKKTFQCLTSFLSKFTPFHEECIEKAIDSNVNLPDDC